MFCRPGCWTVPPCHIGHLLFANSHEIQRNMNRKATLKNSLAHRHQWSHGLHSWSARTTISPFHILCSSPPKESGSLVNDHGAEDEYVEVDMPPLPESASDLTLNCISHVRSFVFASFHSRVVPCLLCLLPTHFLLSSLRGCPSRAPMEGKLICFHMYSVVQHHHERRACITDAWLCGTHECLMVSTILKPLSASNVMPTVDRPLLCLRVVFV